MSCIYWFSWWCGYKYIMLIWDLQIGGLSFSIETCLSYNKTRYLDYVTSKQILLDINANPTLRDDMSTNDMKSSKLGFPFFLVKWSQNMENHELEPIGIFSNKDSNLLTQR